MRIALVTPYLPHPQDTGGRVRVHQLAKALAASATVHLFAALEPDDAQAEAARCGQGIPPYARIVTHVLQASRDVWGDGSARFAGFPRALGEALAAAHDAKRFDALVIAHSRAGGVAGHIAGATVIVDEPELESTVLERRIGKSARQWLPRKLELRRWRELERRLWIAADVVTTASEDAARQIKRVRPDTGVLIPNGVAVESFAYRPPSRRTGNEVLYVGHMASHANESAARLLVREVLPRLRERVPDVSVTIAGRSPSKAVRALEADDVRVTGTVSALAPLYETHAAFAIPPVLERAMNLKVLEPLACGLPLVAPRLAVAGLPLRGGEHFLAAESIDEMVRGLERVLVNRADLDAMALAGRQAAELLDWEVVGRKFVRVVMAAVVRRRG